MGDRRTPTFWATLRSGLYLTRKGVIGMLYLPNERGQGLVEYALILALVAIVVIIILVALGPAIGNAFSNVYANL